MKKLESIEFSNPNRKIIQGGFYRGVFETNNPTNGCVIWINQDLNGVEWLSTVMPDYGDNGFPPVAFVAKVTAKNLGEQCLAEPFFFKKKIMGKHSPNKPKDIDATKQLNALNAAGMQKASQSTPLELNEASFTAMVMLMKSMNISPKIPPFNFT